MVYLYIVAKGMVKLMPLIRQLLQRGVRIVSYTFQAKGQCTTPCCARQGAGRRWGGAWGVGGWWEA